MGIFIINWKEKMFKASIVFGLLRQKLSGDTYQAPDD